MKVYWGFMIISSFTDVLVRPLDWLQNPDSHLNRLSPWQCLWEEREDPDLQLEKIWCICKSKMFKLQKWYFLTLQYAFKIIVHINIFNYIRRYKYIKLLDYSIILLKWWIYSSPFQHFLLVLPIPHCHTIHNCLIVK